jgi:hypothetical protein
MSRLGKDELPFRLVDMSMEELYREIEDFEIVEPIPSEPESEVEESDTEEATYFENQPEICMSESDDDSDSESDLPLASLIRKVTPIVTPNITQAYSPPTWSNTTKPTAPPIFTHPSGVPDFIRNIENPTPYKIFQEFITNNFVEHLVFQTNLYAEQEKTSSGKNYIPTTAKEMNTFLGINLLMGIKRSPSYKDYWSSAPDLNDPYICRLMSLKRFSWLLSHIHVNNNAVMPERSSPNYDKLFKLRPMIITLSENFEKCLLPSQQLAVDESMIKFKGRSSLKQYMPKKPIKRGYKVWILADKSGYCLKFDLYTGKADTQEKCLGSRVINHLTCHLRGKDHLLYFDNFFCNVPLMEDLKRKGIHAVATVNISRRYLPKFKPDKTMNRGDYQWFTSNTDLAAIKWKDKRSVHMISNYHDPEIVTEVKRKEKNGSTTQVPCPSAVVDYNRNMNYVDKYDQLLSSYKIDRRSKKWWHRIFFYLIDAAVVNSYCIYKLLELPYLSSKDFRRAVIDGLVAERLVSNKRQSTNSQPIQIKKSKPFTPTEIRLTSSTHQPQRSSRRRCALCSTKSKQVRTDWICTVCQVPLCLTKNKSCFQRYHTN